MKNKQKIQCVQIICQYQLESKPKRKHKPDHLCPLLFFSFFFECLKSEIWNQIANSIGIIKALKIITSNTSYIYLLWFIVH